MVQWYFLKEEKWSLILLKVQSSDCTLTSKKLGEPDDNDNDKAITKPKLALSSSSLSS